MLLQLYPAPHVPYTIKSTHPPSSSGACLPSHAAPNVLIWSAVACSSAFPFLFEPQDLLARDALGNIVKFSGERLCLLTLAHRQRSFNCAQMLGFNCRRDGGGAVAAPLVRRQPGGRPAHAGPGVSTRVQENAFVVLQAHWAVHRCSAF